MSSPNCIFCFTNIFYSDHRHFENSETANDCFYQNGKTTLPIICKTLKIPRSSYSADEYSEFTAPICCNCEDELARINGCLEELKNIRKNLVTMRKKMLNYMVDSSSFDSSESETKLFHDTAFKKIRMTILADLSNTLVEGNRKDWQDDPAECSNFDNFDGNITPPRLVDISEGLPLPSPSQSFTSELIPSSPPKMSSKTRLLKKRSNKTSVLISPGINSCIDDSTSSQISLIANTSLSGQRKLKRKTKPVYLFDHIYNAVDSSDEDKPIIQIERTSDPTWAPQKGSFGLEFDSSQSQTFDSLPNKGHHSNHMSKNQKPVVSSSSVCKGTRLQKKRKLKSSVRKIQINLIAPDGKSLESIQTVGVVEDDVPNTLTVEGMLPEDVTAVSFNNPLYDKKFPCTYKGCDKTFSEKARRDLHYKKFHQGITHPYECESCDKSFKSPKQLRSHTLTSCIGPDQEIILPDENPMYKKKRNRVNVKNHQCEHCAEKYRNPGELALHIRRAHTGETPFVCTESGCDKGFVSTLKLEYHIEQEHNDLAPLKCEYCNRGYFREHRLRDHRRVHTGERSYLCEICSKSFSQPAYLRYHQTQHEELNIQPFKCDKCNKRFATPANLCLHVTTQHEKFYRYRCEVCNHGSTHLSHLKLHMRSHTGERPFLCQYCDKGYVRAAQLKIHLRSHTGDRPYKCESCEKAFTNSSKLRRHELLHKGERPFHCNECDKSYTTKSYLNSHKKSCHSPLGQEQTEPTDTTEVVMRSELSQIQLKPIVFLKQDHSSTVVLQDEQQTSAFFSDGVASTMEYGEFVLL